MSLRSLAMAACLCTVWMYAASAQRPGGFRVLGPGGGGAMYHPAISPHDPRTVLVSCDMSGGYITHDGGESWRMFNLRGALRGFVFDPHDPKVIYALGIGLWRSGDNGETWTLLAPKPETVTGVESAPDEAEETLIAHTGHIGIVSPFEPPVSLAIDPSNSKHLFFATANKLWESRNAGVQWELREEKLPKVLSVAILPVAGQSRASAVVVASVNSLSLNTVSAATPLPMPHGVQQIGSVSLDPIGSRLLALVVSNGKLYQGWIDAQDGKPNVNWTEAAGPGPGASITLAASGHDGKTIYASFRNLRVANKTWQGIARSNNLGQHWTLLLKDAGKGSPNMSDGWMTQSLGSGWGEQPLGLDVARSDSRVVYATDLGRTIRSLDGGASWMAVYSHVAPDGGAVSRGLDVLTNYGVHFDPFNARRMFLSNTDVGLMRSENGGHSWHSSVDGAPFAWRNTTYWMAFDPGVRGRAWAVMSQVHDLPRARVLRRDVTKFRGGVVRSEDGGVHWSVSSRGLPETAATHIVLDPKSDARARTLYVATMGRGVYKSVDGGRSWLAKNNGISQPRPLAWKLTLASDGSLFVVISRKSADGAIGNDGDGALYRSRDGAESWERVELPSGVNGPTSLCVDPREPWKMFLSAWARNSGQHGVGGGIYGSVDAGGHWTLLFGKDQHVSDVTANPERPEEMFAVGFESSAWHSVDRGAHWQRIAGYNFKAGLRVTPEPGRTGMVYINTFGGGVWYGSVEGKAGVEDIATKQLMP